MNKPKVKLKKVLKEKSMSQYELAKRLNVPPHHVTKMTKPEFNPTLKTLGKISSALNCKILDLIEE